jgi:hypothetical protein
MRKTLRKQSLDITRGIVDENSILNVDGKYVSVNHFLEKRGSSIDFNEVIRKMKLKQIMHNFKIEPRLSQQQ